MLIKIIYSNVLSYLVKMIYKIHERIVGRNMRDERTIKLLAVQGGLMQICENCGQQISYSQLFFAPRHVKCPKCDAKFKVNIQNYYVYTIMLICGSAAFYFTLISLTGVLKIVAIIAIFFSILLFAPFNQKLVSTANKPLKQDK
ncbi:hypothetical protein [Pseudoalteromonas distincta]|uniref:hypothetical protein n=1 Tax=Pseudoalteromonas distincta TaxID=77608 RepID=UPI0011F27C0C|nr:hypothetical protein [Pseudoalteromonas distincta]KAA1153109.1 hypothetical protein EU511_18735 [Pseudoalteromonas distincta]